MRKARRALALTPLIDVIFLLLLFFMLSTVYAREVDLPLATAAAGGADGPRPAFLELGPDTLALNGNPLVLPDLAEAVAEERTVVIRLQAGVTAQRLVDVLGPLGGIAGLTVRVLG